MDIFKTNSGDDWELQNLRANAEGFYVRLKKKKVEPDEIGRIHASIQPQFERPVITMPHLAVDRSDAECFACARYLVENYADRQSPYWKLIQQNLERVTNASNTSSGKRLIVANRKKAAKPRGKMNEAGDTLSVLVAKLALNPEHSEQTAKELWPHFVSSLKDEFDCQEENGELYCEEYKSGKNPITFRNFQKLVSRYRVTIKNKLP